MNIYSHLAKQGKKENLVLATIIKTSGSTPQVSGAGALFSKKGLTYGTIGGGMLENTVIKLASETAETNESRILEFDLNAGITDTASAICGGAALVLIDANPIKHKPVFIKLKDAMANNRRGILITNIQRFSNQNISIERHWLQEGDSIPAWLAGDLSMSNIWSLLDSRKNLLIKNADNDPGKTIFLEPVFPVKKLLIIGGGHVGKALSHIANLIDFETTVIDDRPEFANQQNFPEAYRVICGNIEEEVKKIHIDSETYIVIVTHGHINDAVALKHCIRRGSPYIGMIGSRRKTRLIKNRFINNNWASKRELDAIYAPIGLNIGSESVQEIAVSIAAELIKVASSKSNKKRNISIVILAAGASKRMGAPKMLLPYESTTIIETVVEKAIHSKADHVSVVTGSYGTEIRDKLSRFAIDVVNNDEYKSGMLSSVQAGLRFVPKHVKAVMILLGDQPMIKKEVINLLIEAYNNHAERIVIPVYEGKRGHPLLVDMSFKQDIEKLDPLKGLRQLIIENPEEILELEVDTPSILKDIDTKEDYERMMKD